MDATETATKNAPRNFRRRFFGYAHAFLGWFLLYLAVGGLFGFAVTRAYTSDPSCVPFNSVFFLIESTCDNQAINLFWSVTVGWPRVLILFPALSILRFKAGVANADWRWLLDAGVWFLYSIPLLCLLWAGTLYWWKRHRVIAAIGVGMVVLEILTLALIK